MADHEVGYFSRVFLVPKKSGGWRLVIDLSQLNQSLAPVTFTMDTLAQIKRVLKQGMWATSIDLSDAYHHIPMRESSQVYLCFQVGRKRYMYLVLPFGLMSAPWLFTQVVKQLKGWAAKNNLVLFQYLDDWLNLQADKQKLIQSTRELVALCARLGLLVNGKKSELQPVQRIIFLGEMLDLKVGQAFPTAERKLAVQTKVLRMMEAKSTSLQYAESLVGLLVATYPTVQWGRLYLRRLQHQVIKVVKKGRSNEAMVRLSTKTKEHLRFWLRDDIWVEGVPFQGQSPQVTICTDASLSGWGVVCQGAMHEGKWNAHRHHINFLELKAVSIALRLFQFRCRNKTVLLLIDNSTAVAYINKLGGTRSSPLLELTVETVRLAESLNCRLVARHIAGKLNVLADLASRSKQVVSSEWKLSLKAFEWVVQQSPWGKPSLEMFANSMNRHLDRYVSPCPDERAWAIDALRCALHEQEVMYAFPPANLVQDFLQRLVGLSDYRLLLVVQWSQGAKWFPLLQSLNPSSVQVFPIFQPLLIQPHWEYEYPNPRTANLHLVCLGRRD
jgi:hypothetical protein